MMLRYVENDARILDEVFERGRQLSDDPLQSLMITLKLLAELLRDLLNGHPGCLIATVTYQERLFDREVRELAASAVRNNTARFLEALARIVKVYQPRAAVEIADIADMFSCVADGGIIMSKVLGDPRRLERQIMAYRGFVQMLFSPASAAAMAQAA
jgi:hypothetical protein